MTAPALNPAEIEANIRRVSDRIANGVKVCDERYRAFLEADHDYDVAFAHAYMNADGPQTEKKYRAELETVLERKARDAADAAYRYADRMAKALESELRALQSVNKSVIGLYSTAGVGER